MKTLNALWTYIVSNRVVAVSILAVLIMFQVNRYNYTKRQEAERNAEKLEINLKAANDEIRLTKAKNGKVEANKFAYLVDNIKELKKTNASLAQEVANTKGDVKSIQKVSMVIKHDTITLPAKVYKTDTTIQLVSSFDTVFSPGNFRRGTFEHIYNTRTGLATGVLEGGEIGITAVTGIKKNKDNYEIFFRSNYPGLTVSHLDGAIIDKQALSKDFKTKQPLITLNGTVGWTPLTYDLKERKADFNINRIGGTIGIGFNLNRK